MTEVLVEPVTMEHGPLMHTWRNHPATRAVSRDGRDIQMSDHLQWLESALGNPSRTLLVGSSAGRPVGFVRFDFDGHGCFEVSIFLDPELRGKGLGPPLLAAGESYLRRQRGKVRVLAETLGFNTPSRRLFERAGYQWLNGRFEKELG